MRDQARSSAIKRDQARSSAIKRDLSRSIATASDVALRHARQRNDRPISRPRELCRSRAARVFIAEVSLRAREDETEIYRGVSPSIAVFFGNVSD